MPSLLASFGFLPSAVLVSVRVGWAWSVCLFLRHRSEFFCDARFLWIASLRLPGLLRRDIFVLCREGG